MKKHLVFLLLGGVALIALLPLNKFLCRGSSSFFFSCEGAGILVFYALYRIYLWFVGGSVMGILLLALLKKPLWIAYGLGVIAVFCGIQLESYQNHVSYVNNHTPWYEMEELRDVPSFEGKILVYESLDRGGFREVVRSIDGQDERIGKIVKESDFDWDRSFTTKPGGVRTAGGVSPDQKYRFVATSYLKGKPKSDGGMNMIAFDVDTIEIYEARGSNKVYEVKDINMLYGVPAWNKTGRFLLYESRDFVELLDMKDFKRYIFHSCRYKQDVSRGCVRVPKWVYE